MIRKPLSFAKTCFIPPKDNNNNKSIMSRTNPETVKIKTPCKKFLHWVSKTKDFKYWDKESETEKHIPASTPFICLDVLSTVSGFNKPQKKGVWSNEVRRTTDTYRVVDKDGPVFEGPWQAVKANLNYVKFVVSVYAVAKIEGTYELVNFQMGGSARSAWFDFSKEMGGTNNLFGDIVIASAKVEEHPDAGIPFNAPVFSVISKTIGDDARKAADDADGVLQSYLSQYFEASPEGVATKVHSEKVQSYETPEPTTPAPTEKFEEDEVPF